LVIVIESFVVKEVNIYLDLKPRSKKQSQSLNKIRKEEKGKGKPEYGKRKKE
jgi:hypothetical protein